MNGNNPDLLAALRQHFQYPAFRPGQETALQHVFAGRDVLVVMPTGSGKSLIYQLAAVCQPGTALVVSPLVALMKDQLDSLTRRRIPATFVNSSLDLAEQNRRLRALTAGDYKLVFVAPERFRNPAFRAALDQISLTLLAVDEAHCLSQWGHDFRPDYLYLAEARRQLNPPVTLALTATATPRVQTDIIRLLGLNHAERVITGFNRPNLTFRVLPAHRASAKLSMVLEYLRSVEGAGIIYTGTRREAEEVAAEVRARLRRPAEHYHAALNAADRARLQDAFMAGDLPLVVATNAFGMGIDRPDVRFVLHYAMPGSFEAYYQEAGRAGRDGLPAEAALIYASKDVSLQRFFIDSAAPTGDELRLLHRHIRALSDSTDLAALEEATKLNQTKARVALEQLESVGAVRRVDEAYGRMSLTAHALTDSVLRKLESEAEARRRHRYDLLQRMVDYAQSTACRRRLLLHHFGDNDPGDLPPDACCDNCARRQAPRLVPRSQPARPSAPSAPVAPLKADLAALSKSERAALIVLDATKKLDHRLGKSRMAQYLHGSRAEAVERLKGGRYYAVFAELRLADVEALIEQLLDSGHLAQTGGLYPTLALTPLGETALTNRAAIRVEIAPLRPQLAERRRAEAAGGTVALTGELLARGLTPEQIAAERGLAESTIYSHLAALIAEGRVDVNAVVPAEKQAKIIAAIEAVGSAAYLAPIKARLDDLITYSEIRCVAEAWKRRQRGAGSAAPNG